MENRFEGRDSCTTVSSKHGPYPCYMQVVGGAGAGTVLLLSRRGAIQNWPGAYCRLELYSWVWLRVCMVSLQEVCRDVCRMKRAQDRREP